jgi:hypothetical protein
MPRAPDSLCFKLQGSLQYLRRENKGKWTECCPRKVEMLVWMFVLKVRS